eukprot:344185-Hanusia_phi.AAC.3
MWSIITAEFAPFLSGYLVRPIHHDHDLLRLRLLSPSSFSPACFSLTPSHLSREPRDRDFEQRG